MVVRAARPHAALTRRAHAAVAHADRPRAALTRRAHAAVMHAARPHAALTRRAHAAVAHAGTHPSRGRLDVHAHRATAAARMDHVVCVAVRLTSSSRPARGPGPRRSTAPGSGAAKGAGQAARARRITRPAHVLIAAAARPRSTGRGGGTSRSRHVRAGPHDRQTPAAGAQDRPEHRAGSRAARGAQASRLARGGSPGRHTSWSRRLDGHAHRATAAARVDHVVCAPVRLTGRRPPPGAQDRPEHGAGQPRGQGRRPGGSRAADHPAGTRPDRGGWTATLIGQRRRHQWMASCAWRSAEPVDKHRERRTSGQPAVRPAVRPAGRPAVRQAGRPAVPLSAQMAVRPAVRPGVPLPAQPAARSAVRPAVRPAVGAVRTDRDGRRLVRTPTKALGRPWQDLPGRPAGTGR